MSEGVQPRWLGCPVARAGTGEEVLEVAGACTATRRVASLVTLPNAEVGRLVVEGTKLGVLEAAEQSIEEGCFASAPMVDPRADLFEPGDALRASGSGGASFPEFESELLAPDSIFALTVQSELPVGSEMTIVWTSSGQNPEVAVVVDNGEVLIRCPGLPDTGLLDIPGSLTQYLEPNSDYNVIVASVARHRFTPEGAEVGIEFQAQSATFSRARAVP